MSRAKKAAPCTRPIFREPQPDFFEQSYEEELEARKSQPVECLGMTFDNDEARRNYFLDKLREQLKDPEFRKIEGFPIGDDEDILRLSDPPYYTACPNPFLADFVRHYGTPYLPTEASSLHSSATAEDGPAKAGRINYTVWSEVFTCPECSREVVFVTEALDQKTKRVREEFPCPHCSALLSKDNLVRTFETLPDPATGAPWKRIKLRPVLIDYSVGKAEHEKAPDEDDLARLARIAELPLPPEVPTARMPVEQMYHGSRIAPKGFTHVHHFFLPRQAQALAALWRKAEAHPDARIRSALLFFVEQAIWTGSVLNSYRPTGYSQVSQYMKGIYYVPSQHSECSPWYILRGKLRRLSATFDECVGDERNGCTATTSSTVSLGLPENCIDYVFTDPPFGENIYYADLNFLVESWHRVRIDPGPEAIIDQLKHKTLTEYQELMRRCLVEFHRVLKPGRWMTMVFHNSSNAVWNAIQEAMLAAGFVVADVRTLDKQQGSYRQVTSSAVKQDLVISAYKPNGGLEARFQLAAGTENGVWEFVRTHLGQLPVFVSKDGRAEVIAERQAYLLFDRMVAFHVLRGVTVPLSASEFYAGLAQRFIPRDGMYFLPEQAAEYDKKRMTVKEVMQLELAVSDEASAIEWVRRELSAKPQTLQELTPKFMKEAQRAWAKHEKPLELASLLHESFLCYDGDGEVPSQIHSYLSSNFKELRNRPKDDAALRAKAKQRWYVPDPNKAQDLEKLRDKALLKEFWEYLPPGYQPACAEASAGWPAAADGPQAALPGLLKPAPITLSPSKGKRIKVLRTEAVRAGFAYCWKTRDYRTIIIAVAGRLPDDVLQEDQKLLMWYDQAVTRMGG